MRRDAREGLQGGLFDRIFAQSRPSLALRSDIGDKADRPRQSPDLVLSTPTNAVISYDADSFEPGAKPLGRRSAGLGLIRGFVEHAGVDSWYGYSEIEPNQEGFEAAVRRFGGAGPVHWSTVRDVAGLQKVGSLHIAGPFGAGQAFHRRGVDQRGWSLTGVTHTMSSHAAADAIASLVTAPVQSWDALICSSRAVRAAVQSSLDEQCDYLSRRFGGAPVAPALQLPVIPLGVRCADFAAAPERRAAVRAQLGIPDGEVVVLYAARLSFHAKAHPYPMYLALQKAAKLTGKPVHLLLAGWFSDSFQERVYREGAAALCPDVKLHVIDGSQPGVWEGVWQAGDVYTLLSDNIQESFGLSPVEALSAGLPVVGSDWDGLKDTIVHGETGFLAPTLQPQPGAGFYLSGAYDVRQISYDQYIAGSAMSVAIDVDAAADAFAALIGDDDLRRRMGLAARQRALSTYDWGQVIPKYQALWRELAERRAKDQEIAPRGRVQAGNPARDDPFRTFAAYPTRPLLGGDRVISPPTLAQDAKAIADLPGVHPILGVAHKDGELLSQATVMANLGEARVDEVLNALPDLNRWRALRTILWMHKYGLVAVKPPEA
jgi:glycosyltransferase involved in cell wall biosynthesis